MSKNIIKQVSTLKDLADVVNFNTKSITKDISKIRSANRLNSILIIGMSVAIYKCYKEVKVLQAQVNNRSYQKDELYPIIERENDLDGTKYTVIFDSDKDAENFIKNMGNEMSEKDIYLNLEFPVPTDLKNRVYNDLKVSKEIKNGKIYISFPPLN